jgi:hypothetical protein
MVKVHGTSDTDVWAVGPHGVTAHYEVRLAGAPRQALRS